MLRTLNSGITGLQNHQTQMDVVGNNLANANTTGFKASRTLFEDSLSQTVSGASRPGGLGEGMGGINSTQIGMGAKIAAVQTLQGQGNLQSTGQTTDLAIDGEGFFVVSDGKSDYYTRDGSLTLDASGHMVNASGLVLQGLLADKDGQIDASRPVDDILIPLSTQSPASATTEIDFARNLNADSAAEGTITFSEPFLCTSPIPVHFTKLTSLHDASGRSLNIRVGDTLSFSVESGGTVYSGSIVVGSTTNTGDLGNRIRDLLRTLPGLGTASVFPTASSMRFVPNGGTISNFYITSDNPKSSVLVTNAFQIPSSVTAQIDTDSLYTIPDSNTLLSALRTSDGNATGLQSGDIISIAGAVGGKVDPASTLTYNAATTTMNDLLEALQNQLRLPNTDGTIAEHPTVSINASGTDDNLPDGSIVIRGMPGTTFSLGDISIQASNSNNANPSPAPFNTNMSFTEFQKARETQQARTSIVTYDDTGYPHTVEVTFTPTQIPDQWLWEASTYGPETIVAGHRGSLTFGPDGTVSNFAYQDGSAELQIDPRNGAGVMSIRLNPGSSGQYSGLTQFAAPTTAVASSQDGYTMGAIKSIAVSADGVVQGFFDNGTVRALAKIMIAQFSNPSGLVAQAGNVFAASANSGDPILTDPASGACTIKPGTLEMSNVDISEQFTNLITTQRGYQANARVISQADTFLEEVVNLMR